MEKQLGILTSVLGSYQKTSREYLFTCPKCKHHKKKLSVNLQKNVFKCWICDFSGKDNAYLIKRYGTASQLIEFTPNYPVIFEEQGQTKDISLPIEFVSLCTNEVKMSHTPFLNYLKNRQISKSDIFEWKMGFCFEGRYKNRVVIPSYDSGGKLNYFIARSITNSHIKYMNPPASRNIVFNELMVDWSRPVVIVEGIFDAIKFENSIPILGSTLRKEGALFQAIITHRPTIYIGLDEDASRKEEQIIENLLLYGLSVYRIPKSSFGDYGSTPKSVCQELKEKAIFVSDTDYLLYQKMFSEAYK